MCTLQSLTAWGDMGARGHSRGYRGDTRPSHQGSQAGSGAGDKPGPAQGGLGLGLPGFPGARRLQAGKPGTPGEEGSCWKLVAAPDRIARTFARRCLEIARPPGPAGGDRGIPGSPRSRPPASRLTPASGLIPGPVHHRRARRCRLSPGAPRRPQQHAPGHVSAPPHRACAPDHVTAPQHGGPHGCPAIWRPP